MRRFSLHTPGIGASMLLCALVTAASLWAQAPQPCKVELFIGDPEFHAGDDGAAVDAKLWTVTGLEVAPDGSIYLSDSLNNRIRKIDPQGTIKTIAGTGTAGNSGEGGPAIAAQLSQPTALALAPNGALYFFDDNGRSLRRITPGGTIESVEFVPRGDARDLSISTDGDVYFSRGAEGIFRVLAEGGSERVAGGGFLTADGVDALDFDFGSASELLVLPGGDILVADGVRVFSVGGDGKIHRFLGGGSTAFQEGVAPLELDLGVVFGIEQAAGGALLVASSRGVFSLHNGVLARRSELLLSLMATAGAHTVFAKATSNQILRLLDDDSFKTIAGLDMEAFYEPGRALNQTLILSARGLQTDSQGRLYYYDLRSSRIFRTTLDGKVEVFAGGGELTPATGINAKQAALVGIRDTAIDELDRFYVSVDGGISYPRLIIRIDVDGTITVVAGGGPEYLPGQEIPALLLNLIPGVSVIATRPGGRVVFTLGDKVYEVGADGIARFVYDSTGQRPTQLKSDPSGGFLAIAGGAVLLFEDTAAAPIVTRPTQQPALAVRFSNQSLFLIDQGRLLRLDPNGRTTDYIARGAGFSYGSGQLDINAALPFPFAATVTGQGDLFIADHGLSRVFIMRNADTCTLDRPFVPAILHGASFNGASTAPGTIASAFGQNLGPVALAYGAPGQGPNGTWQTSVGGLEVLVDGQPAPIIFSRTDQAAFVYPNGIREAFRLQFRRNGLLSSSFLSAPVPNASPGLFTANSSGSGQAAALNQDSSINSPANPAAAGSVIVLYLTGAGATNPPSVTGSLNDFPLPQLVEPAAVTINGESAVVEFAGPAPGLISGVVQVNARIPANAPSGAVPVSVTIGGVESPTGPSGQPVTIFIQ